MDSWIGRGEKSGEDAGDGGAGGGNGDSLLAAVAGAAPAAGGEEAGGGADGSVGGWLGGEDKEKESGEEKEKTEGGEDGGGGKQSEEGRSNSGEDKEKRRGSVDDQLEAAALFKLQQTSGISKQTSVVGEKMRNLEDQRNKAMQETEQLKKQLSEIPPKPEVADILVETNPEDPRVVDVSLSNFKFARPFRYFITVRLDNGERQQSELSAASDKPKFATNSFLLKVSHGEDLLGKRLVVEAHLVLTPPGETANDDKSPPPAASSRFLGVCGVPLLDLSFNPDGTSSPFEKAEAAFKRTVAEEGQITSHEAEGEGNPAVEICVGSADVKMQVRRMRQDEWNSLQPSSPPAERVPSRAGESEGGVRSRVASLLNTPRENGPTGAAPSEAPPGPHHHPEKGREHPASMVSPEGIHRGGVDADRALMADLSRSLWSVTPFRSRLRVLIRSLSLCPQSNMSSGTVAVCLRLLRYDSSVLHETSTSHLLLQHGSPTIPLPPNKVQSLRFEEELELPVARDLRDLRAQVVAVVQSGQSRQEVLKLTWMISALPPCHPVHVSACSSPGRSALRGTPSPSLLFSAVSEPAHSDLPHSLQPVEIRIHGVPLQRPLVSPLSDIHIAFTPDYKAAAQPSPPGLLASGFTSPPMGISSTDPRVPVLTFLYDSSSELSDAIARHCAEDSPDCRMFVAPGVKTSRTPWCGGFVCRALMSPAQVNNLSFFVFAATGMSGGMGTEGESIPEKVAAFASLDASPLTPHPQSGQPFQRSFLLDLRVLTDPSASPSLEIEARVWPLQTHAAAGPSPPLSSHFSLPPIHKTPHAIAPPTYPPSMHGGLPPQAYPLAGVPASSHAPEYLPPISPPTAAAESPPPHSAAPPPPPHEALPQTGGDARGKAEALKLDHGLSLELTKEFSLRAAALRKAGEEIAELQRQNSLLRSENARLKKEVQEEKAAAEEALKGPGGGDQDGGETIKALETLDSESLCLKLRQVLIRYRQEKAKSEEMKQRLQTALKEISRTRGLQRQLEEMENAHMEQSAQLQELREEQTRLHLYKQTARSQEKVIKKLERVLETSLGEVQRAQQLELEMERLKSENFSANEKVRALLVKKKYAEGMGDDVKELKHQLKEKDLEVKRLERLVKEFEARGARGGSGVEIERLQEEKLQWELKCEQMDQRILALERELTEQAKKFGREISGLQLDVAKKDAQILQLTMAQ
uniref:Uncharacterized protein n=1 Tax=Chromera velia CCMP2878 TaxID=1169474 RepID=A0A0G4HXT2_9ALVE|eukprot:Cvel_9335.t1-p1 / transcript=Cvel_9335.t1 / gene=Cvel_9335 / organism=Chromera_velia_CCMP2878 / gene_product=Kinesin-like protein KIF7, putative / transcript_product=Kinesin-like protein KIF7, putative / location=Cvel_scaffold535:60601-67160(-) / protein_length=1205 / sequence_SO=supercontig / SO=protein_coding / is_pseudo=false